MKLISRTHDASCEIDTCGDSAFCTLGIPGTLDTLVLLVLLSLLVHCVFLAIMVLVVPAELLTFLASSVFLAFLAPSGLRALLALLVPLNYSPRIFETNSKRPHGILRGPGDTDS